MALAFGPAPRAFGQGTAFTYQGSLTDSASPANGNYDLEFYLRDAASGGSPVGTTNTIAPVAVSNGLFTVTLDFGAGVFDGTSRWLEIGVRTNGSLAAYATLSPRQALTPSPYAIFATVAGGAANGAITSAMLANGSVTSNKVANGAIGTAQLGSNVVTSANIAAGAVGALQIANNAITGQQLADTIALGTSNAYGRLDIYHTPSNTPSISLLGELTQLSMFGADAQQKVSLDVLPGWGQLTLRNNSPLNQQAAVLTANAMGGGSLSLNDSNGLTRALIFGADNGGQVQLFRPSGTNTITLFGNGSQLSTYGDDGLERVRLWGPSYGEVLLKNDLPGNQVAVQLSADGSSGGILYLNNTNGSPRAQVSGANNGGLVQLFQPSGINTVTLFGNGSQISTYGSDGLERVRLWGPVYGEVLLKNSLTGNEVAVQLTANGSSGGTLYLNDTNGLTRAEISGDNGGGSLSLYRSDGTETITMSADDGIYATSVTGPAVYAASSSGPALTVGSGAIQVSGAGVGTSTAAFIHLATTNNTPTNSFCTTISNPLCNGNSNALLFVTPTQTAPGVPPAFGIPVFVCYGGFNGTNWIICPTDLTSPLIGRTWNVLIIKP
ncbi:hypothetical protein SBV1_2400011 [Verrucomicrobia bacterium]|nr:hypothetical protein SBV1_2400011 [Verrucomicrobiota bacterium]